MTGSNTGATCFFAASLLVSGLVVGHHPQSGPTLNALTLPSEALPSGCALQQPAPRPESGSSAEGTVVRSEEWPSFSTNPWLGTDRKLVAEVRKAIDGTPRLPDGPPLGPRDAAAFLLKLADNVVEAYRAAYVTADGSQVAVWAVRFNDKALATPEPLWGTMNPPRGFRNRLVRGATVVLVTARSPNACARAVDAHIRSLK